MTDLTDVDELDEPDDEHCATCGIVPGGEEERLYPLGSHMICSWCKLQISERGSLPLMPYNHSQLLNADGSVEMMELEGGES